MPCCGTYQRPMDDRSAHRFSTAFFVPPFHICSGVLCYTWDSRRYFGNSAGLSLGNDLQSFQLNARSATPIQWNSLKKRRKMIDDYPQQAGRTHALEQVCKLTMRSI